MPDELIYQPSTVIAFATLSTVLVIHGIIYIGIKMISHIRSYASLSIGH